MREFCLRLSPSLFSRLLRGTSLLLGLSLALGPGSLRGAAAADKGSASEQSSVGGEEFGKCTQLFQSSVRYYQLLAQQLPRDFKRSPRLPTDSLLGLTASDCREDFVLKQINKALAAHSGRIALLLPLSTWPDAMRQAVIEQVNGMIRSRGADPAKILVWVDTYGTKQGFERGLAQMVFLHHPAALIGGLTQAEAPLLASWAHALKIPSIILNRRQEKPSSKYVFYLGPDLRLLASSLSRYAQHRGLRRITILMPQSSRDGVLVDHFLEQAKHLGLETDGPYLYQNHDFASMDGVLRKIFHIDDPARAEEQFNLLSRMKEKAEKEGVPFDSRSVVLPPEIDTNAIFIVDHFKNVRHLARIMNFYGVRRLPLLGIPKWRAFELLDKSEDILQGAVFVDYIGQYQDLPYRIHSESWQNESFIRPTEVGAVDIKLLLSHAVYAADQAIAGPQAPRFALFRRLESSRPPPGNFFKGPTIFRSNHLAYWPSFTFSLGESSLQLLQVANPTQDTEPALRADARLEARP